MVIYAILWVRDNRLGFYWCIKTVELDDIFWDIFDMSDNKNERFSLRIEGAFCCPSYKFGESEYKIENVDELEERVNIFFLSEMEKVDKYVKDIRADYGDFLLYIVEQEDARDLTKLLAYVLLGEYEYVYKIVKNELKKRKDGNFENRGKSIYEYMKAYCRIKMRNKK